ncbi:limbic system-associated membrane protein-like [Chrysoperla carnea]|uniref:limbic system-associated membrane protein-like n=1 Tax=Chrysoperla carnea TaxID=189513 RepID=UPI001D05F99F|nr:limbic system-associated membrane protein-like [Chrysoperla carnea]
MYMETNEWMANVPENLIVMGVGAGSVIEQVPYWEQPFSQPYFDNSTRRETTTTVGQTAYLHCRVRNLGDRAVSWIRKRDLHILTVGILTYTNDQRFQSLHSDGTDEWTLKVSSPQTRDTGTYECQVSTEPKISQAFRLNVVVSKAKILGNPELYIKSGSDINLTCIVLQTPDPPSFIYWYRGGNVINYSQRGGISVVTEKQTRTSRLLISRALPSDSGNYTCSPSSSDSSSVLVHVLNGEHPAAMQHGNSSSSTSSSSSNTSRASRHHNHFNVLLLLFFIAFLISR